MTAEDLKRILIELGHDQPADVKLASCYEKDDMTIEFYDGKRGIWMDVGCGWWEDTVCYYKPVAKSIEEWLLDLYHDFQQLASCRIRAWGDVPEFVAGELKIIILKAMEGKR